VIVALDPIARHDTKVERHLAVSTAVFERKHPPLSASVKHDRVAGKVATDGVPDR
jgi:hypothetical protein